MTPYFETSDVTIYQADSRTAWRDLPEHSADAIVTSPPYWGLRDYGHDGQIGLEDDPATYIGELADLLTGDGSRVLKPGGSLWLNLGDTFLPSKCLAMIPERVALALIERGWILRNRVVWAKPNGMPSSVQDRLATKHEALFHFVRQQRYFYDLDAIREPLSESTVRIHSSARVRPKGNGDWKAQRNKDRNDGESETMANGPEKLARMQAAGGKNPGDVWSIPTQGYPDAHFAVFPRELVRRPILATVPEGGTVLDPFFGSGTTAVAARSLGRKTVGVELSEDYCALAAKRFTQNVLDFGGDAA
jgi:DNA modification methylase